MRYSGKLAVMEKVEVEPGEWIETETLHDVLGDVETRTETLVVADSVNPVVKTTTSVSILSRAFFPTDNSKIRYLTFAGRKWRVNSIVTDPPRVVLYLGEEYRGKST